MSSTQTRKSKRRKKKVDRTMSRGKRTNKASCLGVFEGGDSGVSACVVAATSARVETPDEKYSSTRK